MNHPEMHPHHAHRWIIVMLVAIAVMSVMAVLAQRPELKERIPGFAPTPTPTPIVTETITLSAPTAGSSIAQQFVVEGSTTHETITIKLSDPFSGDIYGQGTVATGTSRGPKPFSVGIEVSDDRLRPGQSLQLELYHESDNITIPVIFNP